MKRNNTIVLHGLVSIQKQEVVTITRLNDRGRKISEQVPMADCILRSDKTAPLGLGTRHRVVVYGERALETLAFISASQGEPLDATAYGWLRSEWENATVRTTVVADRISFHVSAELRLEAVQILADMRNGGRSNREDSRYLYLSHRTEAGPGLQTNSVVLDGIFVYQNRQMMFLGEEIQTPMITGTIRTGEDASLDVHRVTVYGSLVNEMKAITTTPGASVQIAIHGWLRNRWLNNELAASDVVAEQMIFYLA